MTIREELELREQSLLARESSWSIRSQGRERPEEESDMRTCYMRDRDRILHCKSFRRMKHKTQVFLAPEGDHYRTRLTHTLEVAQIARTIARVLRLNEDLTEAIALGHDLGHTPFGHAGERVLDQLKPGGFKHYEQGVRVVSLIENDGKGLNLTYEVRDGILRHTNMIAETKEGCVVRYADVIAYLNHDIDDAIRANILREEDIPREITDVLGHSKSERITTLVTDLVNNGPARMELSEDIDKAYSELRKFMFANVYRNPKCKSEEEKTFDMLSGMFRYYVSDPSRMPALYRRLAEEYGAETAACDYIAGMSDKYAVDSYINIFVPSAWHMR